MVFRLFSRKKRRTEPADPLAAYDAFIEDLDRQGAELRKAAAALLTLRGELTRSMERYETRLGGIESRRTVAEGRGDDRATATLERDRSETRRLLESTRESLARVEADAQLLMEATRELTERAAELRAERASAQARLSAGAVVSEALRERSERIAKALALDAARDEVERAHALAEIYREEREKAR